MSLPRTRIEADAELVRYVGGLLGQESAWGATDCNAVALGWVDRLTGLAPDDVLGHYTNEQEAWQFCRGYGRTLGNVLAEAGLEELTVSPAFAQPGDILLVDGADPWTMAHICVGSWYVHAVPGQMIQARPMSHLYGRQVTVWRWAPCRP